MANPKGNQYSVNLGSSAENIDLTLDKYKGEINTYQGFIKKNSPFISNELKNVYTKSENKQTVVDYNSNTYYVENNKLYKNGEETGMEFTDGGFVSIEKSNEKLESTNQKIKAELVFIDNEYKLKVEFSCLRCVNSSATGIFYIPLNSSITSSIQSVDDVYIFEECDAVKTQSGLALFQFNCKNTRNNRFFCAFAQVIYNHPVYVVGYDSYIDTFALLNSYRKYTNVDTIMGLYLYVDDYGSFIYDYILMMININTEIRIDVDRNDDVVYCVNKEQNSIPYLFDDYYIVQMDFVEYLARLIIINNIDINSIFKFTENYIYLKSIPQTLNGWGHFNSYIISIPIIINYSITYISDTMGKLSFDKTKLEINSTENSGVTYYELCSNPYYYTKILDDNSIEYLEYLCRETQMINFGIDGGNFNRSYLIKILFALGKWDYRTNYSGGIYNIDAIDYLITTGSPARTARDYNIATINSNGRYKRFCSNATKDFKILQDTSEDFIMKLPICMYAVKYTDSINYDTDVNYSDIIDKRTLPLKSFFVLDGFINNDNVLYFYGDTKIVTSQNSADDFGHIRLLYIQNIISGVSVYQNASDDGNIVTQWLNIDDAKYIGNDQCIIKMTDDNNIYLLTAKNATPQVSILLNRYIAINTRDYYNAWDIKYNKPVHLFSDWNNRLDISSHYELITPLNDVEYEFPIYSYSTQIMNGYTLSDAIPPSANFSPSFSINIDEIQAAVERLSIKNLDIFISVTDEESGLTSDINPVYQETMNKTYDFPISYLDENISQYIDSDFKNIPMFSTSSGSVVQLIKPFLGNSTPVISQNGIFYPIYSSLSSTQAVEECFAIQSQVFAIVENLIYSCVYNSGVLEQFSPILEITGLQFIASTPEQALFWSPAISALISFRGDNLTSVLYVTDDISEIYFAKYNPQTKDTVIVTDIGIYVLNQLYSFKIEEVREEEESYTDCFVSRYGFNIVTDKNTYLFSYSPLDNYTRNNVNLRTKYYGLGNNLMTITDCVYIRFYNPFYDTEGVEDEETHEITYPTYKVKFGINILTDKSTQYGYDDNGDLTGDINLNDGRMTREINRDDWDKLTHTYYMRFQPPVQKARGMMLEIDSEIPITNIDFSVIPESIMITKN